MRARDLLAYLPPKMILAIMDQLADLSNISDPAPRRAAMLECLYALLEHYDPDTAIGYVCAQGLSPTRDMLADALDHAWIDARQLMQS